MSETKLLELKKDVEELEVLLTRATRKRVQDFLSLELRKLETEILTTKESLKASFDSMQIDTPPKATTSGAHTKRYEIKLNGYGWDQSDKYVKIFVTLKNAHTLPKSSVYCTLTERSMELHVENLDNKDYLLIINKLLEPISIENSHWKQKTDMVVVFLAKAQPGRNWSHVTELEKRFEDNKANRFKSEKADSKDPQDSIMGLMKTMYESGDDEMKKMIAKAWTEGQDKKKTDTVDL